MKLIKNKLLSLITAEQLIEDFKEFNSVYKIANKYKISTVTVYSAFKIINYNCRINKDINSLLSKEILEEAYNRLKSLKAIGRELNIGPDSIKIYMEKFGLKYKKQTIYNCDHDFFSIDNEKSLYIAGFVAADGCVKSRKVKYGDLFHELSIGLSIKDKPFLEQLKSILKAETPIRDFLIKNSNRNPNWNDTWSSQISITSKKMFNDLARFNIIPRKTLIYTFPEWLKTHPLKHHFIRGYNDGDGSFYILKSHKKTKQICFCLRGTVSFLKDIRSILESECNLKKRNTEIRINNNIGCLEYGGNIIISKIVNYLYKDATIYLPRKYEIAVKAKPFENNNI